MEKRRVLISVSDKNGIAEIAQRLIKLGFEIVSSGGTAKLLRNQGVSGVMDVAEVTGFPEMMDGRVKTLHPKIHGGILGMSSKKEHLKNMEEHGIERIHLVIVDLYPFVQTIAKPGVTLEDAIENIDIGGPTLIRAAAKNYPDVIVVCDPADRNWVLNDLEIHGQVNENLRRHLAQKVYATMSRYDGAISRYLSAVNGKVTDTIFLENGKELAYAENKCQNPAYLFSGGDNNPLAMTKFEVAAGNPSYIAIADGGQLVGILCLIAEAFRRWKKSVPYIVIAGKHGNPCGAAIDWYDPLQAIDKALRGDTVAVMGSEVVTNFSIKDEYGQGLYEPAVPDIGRDKWGLDLVLAPEFSTNTVELLGKKEKRRLMFNTSLLLPPFPGEQWTYREVFGGDWLRQRPSPFVLTPDQVVSWAGPQLTGDEFENLILAFACCWRASSNTVALAKERRLIGLGCGQQDRIACVRLCLDRANRAGHDTRGALFASDGFFPYAETKFDAEREKALLKSTESFNELIEKHKSEKTVNILNAAAEYAALVAQLDNREGPQLLMDAGCAGGVVPADGKELPRVQEFFKLHGASVAFVAPENRGFAKH